MFNRSSIVNRKKELAAYSIFIVCVLINSAYSQYVSPENSKLFNKGWNLTQQNADHLESLLLKDPDNVSLRIQIIGYYNHYAFQSQDNTKKYYDHLKWFIRYHPELIIYNHFTEGTLVIDHRGVSDNILSDISDYNREVKKLWQEHIRMQPDNIKIILNISLYYTNSDRSYSIEILDKARKRFPDNRELLNAIGSRYDFNARYLKGKESQEGACKSLDVYEEKYKLSSEKTFLRYNADDMALMAVICGEPKKAKFYANKMLSLAVELPADYRYGDMVHLGNIYLGHVALMENDIDLAEKYLIKASKAPGTWSLPDTGLANKLLTIGKKDTVLVYLELCKKFHKRIPNDIDEWIETINSGGTPLFWRVIPWR